MSVHKNFNPIGSTVWPAIDNIYKYECLLYFIDGIGFRVQSIEYALS